MDIRAERSIPRILSLAKLADACSFSETHFRRLFVESMNMTPMEYLNLVRVRQACDLMKKSNLSMGELYTFVLFLFVYMCIIPILLL